MQKDDALDGTYPSTGTGESKPIVFKHGKRLGAVQITSPSSLHKRSQGSL